MSFAVLCVALLAVCLALVLSERRQAVREREWALERGSLLQRIQSPEIAVYENAVEGRKPTPKLGFEDDKAFMALRKMRENGGS